MRFKVSTMSTGPRRAPFKATGTPCSKAMTTTSGWSGASSGSTVSLNISLRGASHGSSRLPPSWERCQRFPSRLNMSRGDWSTGTPWALA